MNNQEQQLRKYVQQEIKRVVSNEGNVGANRGFRRGNYKPKAVEDAIEGIGMNPVDTSIEYENDVQAVVYDGNNRSVIRKTDGGWEGVSDNLLDESRRRLNEDRISGTPKFRADTLAGVVERHFFPLIAHQLVSFLQDLIGRNNFDLDRMTHMQGTIFIEATGYTSSDIEREMHITIYSSPRDFTWELALNVMGGMEGTQKNSYTFSKNESIASVKQAIHTDIRSMYGIY